MRTTIKMLLLSTLLTIACCAFGTQDQKPVYDPVAQKINWTVTEDTTAQMVSCNSQIPPMCAPFWHTSNIQLSIKNKRTGVTVTAHAGNTGAVATATLSIAALPGDDFDYTETDQVYCPAGATWLGFTGGGNFYIAYTQVIYIGPMTGCHSGVSNSTWCEFRVANFCSAATTPPDANLDYQNINDRLPSSGPPNGWDVGSVCYGVKGVSPKACIYGVAIAKFGTLVPANCTKT